MREVHEKVRVGILLRTSLMFTLVMVLPSWAARPGRAENLVLLTQQEALQLRLNSSEWRSVAAARALSLGPQILVRRPRLVPGDIPTIEAQTPTDLDVIFQPRSAPVRMDSLSVTARKGFFSKSLTELLRPYIQGNAIKVSKVEIPTGRFTLDISIADANGNISDDTYRLEVSQ
ncbi:MAG: hypothetical protein JOZ29_21495 [Deltaproteobacteria bacterium]|nr:hypothetical protein [Deltaproteobacteria bacterium]